MIKLKLNYNQLIAFVTFLKTLHEFIDKDSKGYSGFKRAELNSEKWLMNQLHIKLAFKLVKTPCRQKSITISITPIEGLLILKYKDHGFIQPDLSEYNSFVIQHEISPVICKHLLTEL